MNVGWAIAVAAIVLSAAPDARAERSKPARAGLARTASEHRLAPSPKKVAPDPMQSREPASALRSPRPLTLPVNPKAQRREAALVAELLRDREAQVIARRREAMRLLERFVAEEKGTSPAVPDALLRLSELTWETERAAYLTAFEAFQGLPEAKRPPKPPEPDYTRSVALYERILAQHPTFQRRDLVLYMLGFARLEQGQDDAALSQFRRILSDHPTSRFRADAHMALAEHIFNGARDYRAALAEYDRVLGFTDSELYALALFKSAWCLWQLGDTTQAAVRFRKVLDLGEQRAHTARHARLKDLKDEALESLIQVFTEDEQNRVADVQRFLQAIGGEQHVVRVLERLSATYMDQGRFDQGIEAYTLLLSLRPASPKAPTYQLAIARGHLARGDFDAALAAFEAGAALYAPKAAWATQQPDPRSVIEAHAQIETALREQALSLHALGQREGRREPFEQAAALYRVYLEAFAGSEASYTLSFYRAEILFHRLGDHAGAGALYLATAEQDPKGKLTRDALYNAVGAFELVRERELSRCTPSAPCAETENDRKFSRSIELYAQLYPNDRDLPEILFRQGQLYYDRHIYDPAVRLFGQLLERHPRSPFAAKAGELVLDSFNQAQDYANIEKWARKLKRAPAFAGADAQKRLDGLILGAVFKLGEQLAKAEEHDRAAAAYERAAQEFPSDPGAAKALYNAGLELSRAGKLDRADQVYTQLMQRYPGSEAGAMGALSGAQIYESIAQFGDAARFYEAYGQHFPKGPKAADALYNAVVLRGANQEHEAAIRDGARFMELFPNHEALDEVVFMIGRAHTALGRHRDAAAAYRRVARNSKSWDRRIEALTLLGKALDASHDARGADAALTEATAGARKNQSKLKSGRYFAAEARTLQGDQALREFEAVEIGSDAKGLGARLRLKTKLLQKAAAIYADVVDFRESEWVTNALYKVGRAYELFAKALGDAPVPSGLSEAEQEAYRSELASFVVPIEERALEAYEGGYRKARELGIYNRWTVSMREGLSRLNEVSYPPIREIGGDVARESPLAQGVALLGLSRDEVPTAAPTVGRKPRDRTP